MRTIGQSTLKVAPLAFGGNVFGWTVSETQAFTLLDAFTSAGFNLIDTADVYSRWVPGNHGGESETIIGKWMKSRGKRSQVIISTKVGMEVASDKKGLSRRYITTAVEESLRRLQTDYIDLYFSHVDDPKTPLEETLGAYSQLIQAGKIRVIGASNYSGERLLAALDVSEREGLPRYECLQPDYNLYERSEYEQELEPLCLERKLGVISYFSLASGFLSGKYRSETDLNQSQRGERVRKYLNERGYRILQALDEVSEEYQVKPATIALAWLMLRPSITAPIASATTIDQLNTLAAAAQLQLKPDAIKRLDQASAYKESSLMV